MWWRIPSSSGDFQLEGLSVDGTPIEGYSRLVVENPTPLEREKLLAFLVTAVEKKAVEKEKAVFADDGRTEITLHMTVAAAGKLLVPKVYQDKGVLTAVKSTSGQITCVTENVAEAATALDTAAGGGAATVRRPTSCCPENQEGPLKRSSQVLREFCTPSQWASWVRNGFVIVRGGMTGYLYRLAHRHHPLAVEHGKMAYDITNGHKMHWWDWTVPPAEEVLGAKLILEHRENWLRTHSTCLESKPGEIIFQNVLGSDGLQGTWDAHQHRELGDLLFGRLAPMSYTSGGMFVEPIPG